MKPNAYYMGDNDETEHNFFRTYRAYPIDDLLGENSGTEFGAQIFDIKSRP